MYSDSDLTNAVDAGVITPDAARAFRLHMTELRRAPAADEEHFRLLTGFNDIFVSIATLLILAAVAWIGTSFTETFVSNDNLGVRTAGAASAIAGGSVALVSWGLAEYFTRQRRMALPSILLLMAFTGGVFAFLSGLLGANLFWFADQFGAETEKQQLYLGGAIILVAGIGTVIAARLHWRRFMVPITVAVGAATIGFAVVSTLMTIVPEARDWATLITLIIGLLVFFSAMRWDMTDLERRTRRSDVAFWLHLLAAPLIAHSVFQMLGVFDGEISTPRAALVLLLYVGFAFIALATDRRALLVSSLAYVLFALYALFEKSGAVELAAALTALVIGSALLLLSAFWQPMRRHAVFILGDIADRLPPTQQLAPV